MLQGLAVKILFKTISKIVEKIDDNKIARNHDKRLKALEKFSHPPKEYICCRRCGCEIAKTKVKKKEKIVKRVRRVRKKINKLKEKF